MPAESVTIETRDGLCPTELFSPPGEGPWPAVIMYMDAGGVRPAMTEIAERIAGDGYVVMLPNLFYRVDFDATQGMRLFTDDEYRKDLFSRVVPSASSANVMRDTDAFLAHLGSRDDVREGPIGLTGYCMGGRLAVYAAGHFGDRVAAAAAYHPGGLATDAPDSPHLLAPNMTARVYVGAAKDDRTLDDAQKARLDRALTDAGVPHTIETYDALHGFVPRDTPVHDKAATARHWETLLPLFRETL